MRSLLWLAGLLMAFILAFVGFLASQGAFKTIEVAEKEMGPYELVYLEHKGPYQEAGAVVTKVNEAARDASVQVEAAFGIYLDDPKTVKAEDLRSEAGVIVKPADLPKLLKNKALKARRFEKQACLTAEFPFKSPVSIVLGITKVYPAMEERRKSLGYGMTSAMEIYQNQTIVYVFPIKK